MHSNENDESKLVKICYVVLFYFIYSLTDVVLLLIAFVQTLLNLVGEPPNSALKEFGASLGVYVKQIAEYLSYNHEQKPFPFSDWPISELIEELTEENKDA